MKKNFILILIIFIGILQRVNYDLFAPGYIFDELAIVSLAKNATFFEMTKNIANLDYHAPLYYFLISPFTHFENEWIYLRLLNLLFSILNILVFYKIGKEIKNRTLGLLLASLLAINHMHISVVCFVKFYCLCFLILSLIVLYIIKLFKYNKNHTILGILNAIFCLSNTFGFAFVAIEYLTLFYLQKKNKLQNNELFKSFLISSIGFLLYFPILIIQTKYALGNIISPHGYYPSFSLFGLYGVLNDYVSPLLNFSAPLETIEANSLILKVAKDLLKAKSFDIISFASFVLFSFIPTLLSCIFFTKTYKNNLLKPIFMISIGYLFFFSTLVFFEISGLISLYIFPFGIIFTLLAGCGIFFISNKKLKLILFSYLILIQLIIPNSYPLEKRSLEKMKIFHCPIEYIKKIDNKTHIITTIGGRFLKEYFNKKNLYHFDNEQMGASHDKKYISLIYGKDFVKKANKKNIDKIFKETILKEKKNAEFENYVTKEIFSKIKKGEKLIFMMYSDENPFIANENYIDNILSRNDYNYHLADSRFTTLLNDKEENNYSIALVEDAIMSYSYSRLIELIDKNFKIVNVEYLRPIKFDKWKLEYKNKNFKKNTMWLAKNVINGWIFVTYEKMN